MPKDVGLSKGVVITYGSRHAHKPTKRRKTTANKSLKQIQKEKQAHAYEISSQYYSARLRHLIFKFLHNLYIFTVLSFTQREHLLVNQDGDGDVMMDMGNDGDWEDEVQDGLRQLPPGEEGFLQSHAGGEAVLQAIMDGITLS